MCTNNTCNPEVDCPNENDCPSGSDCTSGSGGNCSSGTGSCPSGSNCPTCGGSCNSTVPVQSVTVSPSAITVKIGRWCHDLSATVAPAKANQHVCWSSSDESVASVNPDTGYVFGMGEGTAEIIATSCQDSSISDSCTVTVEPVYVESITLCKTVLEINKGTTYNMCATVCPEDAENKSLEWSSSNETVATVSQDGIITGNSTGWAYIYATAVDGSDVSAVCAVKVISPAISVKIGRPDFTVVVGDDPVLVATVEPTDANNILWSSDNETVATVQPAADSRHGIVTTKAAGVVNITATSKSDSSITDSCQITVLPMRITLDKSTLSVPVCEQEKLTATVQLANTSNKTVKWESSAPSVATVDEDGNVTAKRSGDTTITARISGTDIFDTCVVTVPEFGPGAEFDTLYDAVEDFAKTQYNISCHLRLEVGAVFYEKDNAKFIYTELFVGEPHGCDPYAMRDATLGTIRGGIHTHPNGKTFSLPDYLYAATKAKDVPFFVVTQECQVLMYQYNENEADDPVNQFKPEDTPVERITEKQYNEILWNMNLLTNKVRENIHKKIAHSYISKVSLLQYDTDSDIIRGYESVGKCLTDGQNAQGTYQKRWEDHVLKQRNLQEPLCGFDCGNECLENWPGSQL